MKLSEKISRMRIKNPNENMQPLNKSKRSKYLYDRL